MSTYHLPPKPQRSLWSKAKRLLIAAIVIAIYVWTFLGINIDWMRAIERAIKNITVVIPKLFSPNWEASGEVTLKIIETIFIAFAGSLMAAIIAIPLGFLAARNMTRLRIISSTGKWILSGIRAFPDIILAILFVVAVGPNAFAGVLAISIGSTGMLGKLYSEVIESIDSDVIEAIEASGGNKIQVLFYGVIPQVIPEFLSYAIYRLDRKSTRLNSSHVAISYAVFCLKKKIK